MKTLPTPTVLALARGFNGFGLRLYHQLRSEGNVFFSPLSIAAALAALLPGARGETAHELAEALGVDADLGSLGSAVSELLGALESRTMTEFEFVAGSSEMRSVKREAFRLTLATGLFVEEAYPLHSTYRDLLTTSFRTDWFSLRFGDKTAATAKINEWVAGKTGGRIRRLVSPDSFQPLTRLVLANAVYFLGRWLQQFPTANTRPRPFHALGPSGSKTVQVPMMRQEMGYQYWSDELGLEVLWVPYAAELAMVVLLPREGRFSEVERRLEASLFERMNGEKRERLAELQLPKFELRSSYTLGTPIKALGVRRAFDVDLADFAGITPHADGLALDDVIHQGWIKVDEYGTEAAAATAVGAVPAALEIERPKALPFIVDRPFFFLIQDDRTGIGLFLGRVMDPSV